MKKERKRSPSSRSKDFSPSPRKSSDLIQNASPLASCMSSSSTSLHRHRDGLEQGADPVDLQGNHIESAICVCRLSSPAIRAASTRKKTMATERFPTTPHLRYLLRSYTEKIAGLEEYTRESRACIRSAHRPNESAAESIEAPTPRQSRRRFELLISNTT